MSAIPGVLAALATILAAGFGIVSLCGRRRLATSELLALSWLLGTLVVSVALWLLGFVLRDLALQAAVSLICLGIGLVGVRNLRQNQDPPKSDLSLSWLEVVLLCLFGLETALILYGSFQHTLGWDGLLIWELKARHAFLSGGALPPSYFSDKTMVFSHPDYPLGLPLIEMWFYLWMGDANQFWIKILGPIFYLAGMGLLGHGLADLTGRRSIGLLAIVLFGLVPCLTNSPGGILVGYADLPLAFFYLGSVIYLIRFTRDSHRFSLMVFVLLAAALPWFKRDGMILWSVLAVVSLPLIWRRRNLTTGALCLVPGITVIATWSIFLTAVSAIEGTDFLATTSQTVADNSYRIGPIVSAVGHELLVINRWSVFWPVVALSLVWLAWKQRTGEPVLLAIVIVLPAIAYAGAYVLSAWSDYLGHVQGSLTRLLMQVMPVGWLVIGLALGGLDRLRESNPNA